MEGHENSVVYTLEWYLGRSDVHLDADRVAAAGTLAIVGGRWDDLAGFADRVAAERPVLDLSEPAPSAPALRRHFQEHPETIVLAPRAERVMTALGLIAQPWYMSVSPLSARPRDALRLLRGAIGQLGVRAPIEMLGDDVVAGLEAYHWPRGLHEIREASRRLGAILDGGNISAAARKLAITHQAVSKYLSRRIA